VTADDQPRSIVRALIAELGGRFSSEAGIDVDAGDGEIERWFLAATLFGTRISTATAIRTFVVLDRAGVHTIADAGRTSWNDLVQFLDDGGYARYDFRTAHRLHDLAEACERTSPDGVGALGRTHTDVASLTAALDALPGWGPVTVGAFLRELRGVWPGADLPLDDRVTGAADHLGLADGSTFDVDRLRDLARDAGVDPRDLEAALVRLALAHERTYDACSRSGPLRCDHLAHD
jgi:hypothetical protein